MVNINLIIDIQRYREKEKKKKKKKTHVNSLKSQMEMPDISISTNSPVFGTQIPSLKSKETSTYLSPSFVKTSACNSI